VEQKPEGESRAGQANKQTGTTQTNPVAVILSVVGLAGGVLIIIGGEQLLSIHTPGLRAPGAIANTYYRGLGLALIGFGILVAARCLWSCFRGLGGRWNRR